MPDNAGKTVREILEDKKGSIKDAPLDEGSPSWDEILDLNWEEIVDQAKIAYRLGHCRDEALMIEVDVPGERWEIEFVDYDDEVHVEIERFRSDGHIDDESALEELFAKHSSKSEPATLEAAKS